MEVNMELLKQLSSVRSIEKKDLKRFGQRMIIAATDNDKSHELTLDALSDISDFIYWNFNEAQFIEPFRYAALDGLFDTLKKQLRGGIQDAVRICKALYIIDFCLHTRSQLRVLMWCNENRQTFDDLRYIGGRHRDFFRVMMTDAHDKDVTRMKKELEVVVLLVFDMSKLSKERDEPLEESSWLIRIMGQRPSKKKIPQESWDKFALEVVGRTDRRHRSGSSSFTTMSGTGSMSGTSNKPTTKTQSIDPAQSDPAQPPLPNLETLARVFNSLKITESTSDPCPSTHSASRTASEDLSAVVISPQAEQSNTSVEGRPVSEQGATIQLPAGDVPKPMPPVSSLPPFIATQEHIKSSDSTTTSNTVKPPSILKSPQHKKEISSLPSKRPIPRRPIPRSRKKLDLVQDSRLETKFQSDGVCNTYTISNAESGQRLVKKEVKWIQGEKLGQGGFGSVWLQKCVSGEDEGRHRAVKEIVKAGSAGRGEIDYYRELEAIAKFSNARYRHCFVESYGWYENEDKIFITMEYLKRGDLQQHLKRSWPEEEVRLITSQLLEGLIFMHENGFVHRDLKPANILIIEPSPNWWVKISDFGISKREEEGTAFQTVIGSNGYLAPEVLGYDSPKDNAVHDELSNTYTTAVDLWALGAIIIRLLIQRNLFDQPRLLRNYVEKEQPFPAHIFDESTTSDDCIKFLALVMAGAASDRPSAEYALEHSWILNDLTSDQPGNATLTTNPQSGETYSEKHDSQLLRTKSEEVRPSAAWPTELS